MRSLLLDGGAPELLVIGAHPDDVEIGAGGTLLRWRAAHPDGHARTVVLTGSAERRAEARAAATGFLGAPGDVDTLDLPDGRLPAHWGAVKDALEQVAATTRPDLVLAPSPADAHQDHRLLGELVPTCWRDSLVLHYEIPKWDGDLGRPTTYVALDAPLLERKLALLHEHFPSQRGRDWWDGEVFRGLARLRGMEIRAPYAEAFTVAKARLEL